MPRPLVLSGLYPRREPLVKATWDFDKGLLDAKRLEVAFLDDARELLELQTRLGVTAFTDGNLTWQDPFRGLIEAASGFQVGGVTRFFETNKFYRQPILTGRPVLNRDALRRHFLLESLSPPGPKKAVLPSPYWLVRSAKIETPSNAPEDALVAHLVNDAARWAASHGYAQVQLQEPLLFYEKAPDLEAAKELLTTALKGVEATTTVNFPNGNAAPHLAWAAGLPTDWLGIDFVETHVDELRAPKSKLRLLAQVVDSQESLLESPAEVRALTGRIESRLKPAELTLTHTWELDFLPAETAARKLEVLSRAVTKEVVA
jgi:5-methyltetrahydropteroyltriglutamate--homocysteine methyltransferase